MYDSKILFILLNGKEEIKKFEESLENKIIEYLKKKQATTHEIIIYLRGKIKDYGILYSKDSVQARYRVRKVLKKLQMNGLVENPQLEPGKEGKLEFLNYKWKLK
jgi:hypothetical protein